MIESLRMCVNERVNQKMKVKEGDLIGEQERCKSSND